MHQYIKDKTDAIMIEPTNRTADLGKWFIILNRRDSTHAKAFLDHDFPAFYEKNFGPGTCLPSHSFPRRPNTPLYDHTERAYIELLDDDLPITPQTERQTQQSTFSEVLQMNGENSPPTKSRRRNQYESPSASAKSQTDNNMLMQLTSRLDKLDTKLNTINKSTSSFVTQEQMICLQANQKTSLETLGNNLDSELQNFREDNMKLMEDQRRASQLSISNTQANFTKLIADQSALSESHISSLRNELREDFNRMFNIISSL